MIELPDKYNIVPCEDGLTTIMRYAEVAIGSADRHILAKNIVEGKTKEELIEFIEKMLLGVEAIKRKARRNEI